VTVKADARSRGRELIERARSLIRDEARDTGFRWEPTLVVACATLALLIPHYHKGEWLTELLMRVAGPDLGRGLRGLGINLKLILQLLVPIGVVVAMRRPLRDYGLGLGRVRAGLKLCALCYALYVPCFVVLFLNKGFQEYYAFVTERYATWPQFFLRETAVMALLCLRTEFLYRGFLLFGVKRHYGAYAGILVQLIPYVLVHSGKAELEAIGSLPVGLALAYLAVKTESIWYGVLLHGSIALLFNALILLLYFMSA